MRKMGWVLAFASWGTLAAAVACSGSFGSVTPLDAGDATTGDGAGTLSDGGLNVLDATLPESATQDTGSGVEASAEAGGDTGILHAADAGDAGDARNDGGANGGGRDAGCPVAQVCEPAAPAGWQGPIELLQGAGGAAAPACPAPMVTSFGAGANVVAAPPTCSVCTCGEPAGLACNVEVRLYQGLVCTSPTPCATGEVGTSCTALAGSCPSAAGLGLNAEARATAVAGACAPSKQDAAVPPASWSTAVAGCAPASAQACGTGGVCLPSTSRTCVYQSGASTACPASDYTVGPQVYYETLVDDRSCTACACGGADVSCRGTVTVTSNDTCTGGVTIDVEGGCDPISSVGLSPNPAFFAEVDAGPTPGSGCPPTGGQTKGGVTPTDPITVCCLQ